MISRQIKSIDSMLWHNTNSSFISSLDRLAILQKHLLTKPLKIVGIVKRKDIDKSSMY